MNKNSLYPKKCKIWVESKKIAKKLNFRVIRCGMIETAKTTLQQI